MFSFLTRFFQSAPPIENDETPKAPSTLPIEHLERIAQDEEGMLYRDFPLFYQDIHVNIDLFVFIPHRGICFGEKLPWDFETLEHATVQRSSKTSSKSPATHLERTESLIRQKLEDILSFDTTVCTRFIWLPHLSEEEFDALDPSFHDLLPKERVLFADSSYESIRHKINTMAPWLDEPYSTLKIMGSLQSHTLLLPSDHHPFGSFLSEEQLSFLTTDFSDTVTSLFGEHYSGKSTAIIRKALLMLLSRPKEKLLIITPNRIGGEILRHELISLLEYGALSIDLASLSFSTPDELEKIDENERFLSASAILVDDAHLIDKPTIDHLIAHRSNRWLLLSMHNEYRPISNSSIIFYNHYQHNIHYKKIPTSKSRLLHALLLELRTHLLSITGDRIMVMFDSGYDLHEYKEAIDEYFEINCRVLGKEFSLQYQNLDDLILTTVEYTYGIHVPHLYYVVSDEIENYSYALSRASESATIISVSNPKGDEHE